MSNKSTSKALQLLMLLLGTLMCLSAGGIFWAFDQIPRWAETKFGPPSNRLSHVQKSFYAARLLYFESELRVPSNPYGLEQEFEVELGESVDSIAQRLEVNGIIQNADIFIDFLIYSGMDASIQAGIYELSPSQSSLEIAQQMQDATPHEITFRIMPGWRVEEIAQGLVDFGLLERTDVFLDMAAKPEGLSLPDTWPEDASVEGLLAPGDYTISRGSNPGEVIEMFLEGFKSQLDVDLLSGFDRQGLTLYDAVTLASIVQKEAVISEEQPMIASVFLNRLHNGIKLESDPTVQYSLGYNFAQKTWWTNPLSLTDLEVNSPYNTYKYPELPPGPICSPAGSALQAVAYPAQTDYFFFRARCDGSGLHNFSKDFEGHVQNACP